MNGISPDRLKQTQVQAATKPSPEPSSSGVDMLQARNQPIQDELALAELGSPGRPVASVFDGDSKMSRASHVIFSPAPRARCGETYLVIRTGASLDETPWWEVPPEFPSNIGQDQPRHL